MRHLKNIDSAFKHIRIVSMVWAVCCTCYVAYVHFLYAKVVSKDAERIYILADGKIIVASSSTRKENIPIEAKDHIKTFHELFFTLSPDEKAIEDNIRAAYYLADRSAKTQYDDLKEKGYYSSIVRGNVNQEVSCDSVSLSTASYPYYWRFYGKQRIIRSSATLLRSIVTEGYLRQTQRTENNPHGFLIERWSTIENEDLQLSKR
ncbi:conjugative transposon protein TraK [Chitinophaga sedimenti]|uniref:conjugative transposon protein TraK n=1 Tax=Chitinophaga sedimenti TaxID=2033606 RepID=UPI002005E76A|nr:conjugative transposon protein TraK [Chitinophaga sedimenti]MCK7559427.1 conjugative transposon protein TraK [Chitinophaga sedimenti]